MMSICAEHISFAYNGQPVLLDFNMELPVHGIVGLSGPSGCGKTTLLHLMAGLILPDSGSISGIARNRIGVVFQEDRLLPWLTAAENLNLIFKSQALTAEWLLNVQLSEQANFYPSELSGGMKRRIALARALAFDCDLLLLDEPFQGLDQTLKEKMYDRVRAAAMTKPVLMVTHDKWELDELADQIYIASGPPMAAIFV